MKIKEIEYCEWEGWGNGNYVTECGGLYKDKGRFVEMLNNNYNGTGIPIAKIEYCPNCGRKTITYKELQEKGLVYAKVTSINVVR